MLVVALCVHAQVPSADKRDNPILATQASPGMGKSSFIDLLCSLTIDQVRALSPVGASDDFCHSVSDSQRVVVDYNGNQSVVPGLDVAHPETGLALRILHSYGASAGVLRPPRDFDFRFCNFHRCVFYCSQVLCRARDALERFSRTLLHPRAERLVSEHFNRHRIDYMSPS